MYCSTCGSRLVSGRATCTTCGTRTAHLPQVGAQSGWVLPQTPVAERARSFPAELALQLQAPPPRGCRRCGYVGEGLSYFSRGSHILALFALALLTSGFLAVGGLLYFWAKKDHLICPRCGEDWGEGGEKLSARLSPHAARLLPHEPPLEEKYATVSRAEESWRSMGMLFFLVALALALPAVLQGSLPDILTFGGLSLGSAAVGMGCLYGARRARELRREKLITALQLPVLQLAARKQGRLTVSETAAELGWTLPRAEKILRSLDDGVRVNAEITEQGVIVYHFLELLPPGAPRIPGILDA